MAASDREQILIKNIYYMLAYAFKALQQKNYKDMETVQFDNAQNLFAAILAQGISQQLKQGLYKEYIDQEGNLSVLHGKISFPGTIRNQIAHCQQLYCEYDELSENNLLNQIIKTTALILVGSNEVKKEYRQRLRSEMLFFSSVDEVEPSSIRWSDLRFHRNNETYLMLIGICQLVLNGMLQTEDDGSYKLAAFEDSQEMSHLYEKFLLEYYRREHPELKASASQIRPIWFGSWFSSRSWNMSSSPTLSSISPLTDKSGLKRCRSPCTLCSSRKRISSLFKQFVLTVFIPRVPVCAS